MKKIVAIAIAFSVLFSTSPLIVNADNVPGAGILLSEQYSSWNDMPEASDDAEKMEVCEELGWKIISNASGNGSMYFHVYGVRMQHGAAVSGQAEGFVAERTITVTENGNDGYMKVRRVNFKGIYDVDLSLFMNPNGNGSRFIRFMSGQTTAAQYNITNSFVGWSGVDALPAVPTTAAAYRTRLNFTDSTMRLYYNNAESPAAYSGATDVPMANGSGYLSSLRFYFDRRLANTYIRVHDLKLTEIERTPDPTDNAVEALNTSLLTAAPDNVTEALSLPASSDLGVNGVTVTWTSSHPDVISNDGQTINRAALKTNVTMTAKITNDADGFTQYADFALVVPAVPSDVPEAYETLVCNMLTSESAEGITANLSLPKSVPGYEGITIEWSSDNIGIIASDGKVTRPAGKKDVAVTLTAELSDGTVTLYKAFTFTVLTTYVSPAPKLLIYEPYAGETYTDADLGALGWHELDSSEGMGSPDNGALSFSASAGISMTKTSPVVASNGYIYAVRKQPARMDSVEGDPHMFVRRENFKGTYKISMKFSYDNLQGGNNPWSQIRLGGSFLQLTADHFFAGGSALIGKTGKGIHEMDMLVDTEDGMYQLFFSGNESPAESAASDKFAWSTPYLSKIDFTHSRWCPVNTVFKVESFSLTELDKAEDLTDKALKQLSTALLTNTPDSVTSALSPLPTTFPDVPGVSVTWSSNKPEVISDDGQTVNRAELNSDVIITAELVNDTDGFIQYADFRLTVAGTGSVANVYNRLTYDLLTVQTPSEITQGMTLPEGLPGYDSVAISWSSGGAAITVNGAEAAVSRPTGREDAAVTLTAGISDGTTTLYKTFSFIVKTTYSPPQPVELMDWTFEGKTPQMLYNEGLLKLSDKVEISVNPEGNLLIKKTSDAADGVSRMQAVGFPARVYDDGAPFSDGARTAVFTERMRGHYRIDYLLRISDAGTTVSDYAAISASVNGAATALGSPLGANLMLGYGKLLSYIPLEPLYKTSFNYQFPPMGGYAGKWLRLRFDIDMLEKTAQQVTLSYALGTEAEKPDEGALAELGGPAGGIAFGTSSGNGLLKYVTMFTPQLGFGEQAPKNASIEVANVKITELERDSEFSQQGIDSALSQLTMAAITDAPSAYNRLKGTLPVRVVAGGRTYTVTWSSSSPALIGNDGSFLGSSGDAGKDVYLTAVIKDGALEKGKVFWLTLGEPPSEESAPSVSSVSISGSGAVGGVVSVSYTFNDAPGYTDASEIVWQASQGSSFYDISGATGRTYTVKSSDAGKSIRAGVHPKSNAMGIGQTVYSNALLIQGGSGGGNGGGGGTGVSGGALMLDYGADINDKNQKPVENENTYIFDDVADTHWAASAIKALAALGIINGVGGRVFEPNASVTREQFAKIITLAFDVFDSAAESDFTDVSQSDWSYPYIASLSKYSIILGDGTGAFNKGENITREDIAVIIQRASEAFGVALPARRALTFEDDGNISDYAREAVKALAHAGIINGSEGRFRPRDFCSRAEAAKIVYEIYKLRGGQ